MAKRARGTKGGEAELLFQKWLLHTGEWDRVHRVARPALVEYQPGKFFTQSHDLFNCLDFIAVRRARHLQHEDDHAVADTETWGVQVTTISPSGSGSNMSRRRKKMAGPWPRSWRISLVVHEQVPDPAHRARSLHFWRVQDYVDGVWQEAVAVPFDRAAVSKVRVKRPQKGEAPV